MLGLIQKLIGPVLYGMGVSEADLTSYLTMLSKYIYVLLAALAILILVMIFGGLAKKGSRAFLRLQTLIAFIACVAIVANLICWGPMKTNVANFLNGSSIELTEETVAKSKEVIQKVGEEGIVLLKNDGLLPLSGDVKNLNVFGWASTNPIFGGTGSGSSDASTAVGILGSLTDAGYSVNEDLSRIYTDYRTERPTISMNAQDWTLPEPTVDAYTDDVMSAAKDFSDTAVIVISRSGGENADLPTDMGAVIAGTYNQASLAAAPANFTYMLSSYTNNGSYDDFEAGESYLELSVTEEQMVKKVCTEFDNVVVVINANNPMELNWVEEYPAIKSVLLAPGAGNTGFAALGKILNGSVNPSGRTADTFVRSLADTPYFNNIGNNRYNNVDDLNHLLVQYDQAAIGNISFAQYVEGIYVGYKFYETAFDEGLIKEYYDVVQYPFGYGLSYTSFEQAIENFSADGDNVEFDVTVTNTGDVAGKDVVEVYFTPPYENGGIEKASVNLADFGKTALLDAGASETIHFSIPKDELASYDSNGIRIAGGGYILEAGEYTISVRSDSHNVLASESFTVDADIDYSSGRPSDLTPATNQFQDYSRGQFVQLSRADSFANYDEACGPLADSAYVLADELKQVLANNSVVAFRPSNDGDEMPTQGSGGTMKLAELRGAAYDDERWETLIDQMTTTELVNVVNLGGWRTAAAESVGKKATSDCDGPAGLSNFITGVYGTAYPAELLMAQTWNKALLEEMGEAMSKEYQEANNYGWYGPAMNTHRSAFAGRNFEYFSEDGVLAGMLAAAEINGAAKNGVYPYIKHFALNDQEINRLSVLMTWADEQAIREIYLKPFEIAVKKFEGTSIAVMSSFNWIGPIPSCANNFLLNNVLRDEWGFVGFVETDYDGSYGYMITDSVIRNGGDLMLGFGMAGTNQVDTSNATTVKALRRAVKNIMYTQVNSGVYASEDAKGGMDNFTKTFLIADVAIGACLLLLEILLLAIHGKNKKKRAAKE